MYCKICGNLLNNEDSNCNVCGAVAATPVSVVEEKEEVVFNPPYSPFQAEVQATSEFSKGFEQVDSVHGEEAQVYKQQLENNEFSWNVYDFPRSRKTETVEFTWKQDEFGNPISDIDYSINDLKNETNNQEELSYTSAREDYFLEKALTGINMPEEDTFDVHPRFETISNDDQEFVFRKTIKPEEKRSPESHGAEFFEDIITKEDMNHINMDRQDQSVDVIPRDKFFTFSKKNEEFQKLLDKEYARINELEQYRNMHTSSGNARPLDEKMQNPLQNDALLNNLQPQVADASANMQRNPHLNEMEEARKMFFPEAEVKVESTPYQQNIVLGNEEIKQKYETHETIAEDLSPLKQHMNAEPMINAEISNPAMDSSIAPMQPAPTNQASEIVVPAIQNAEMSTSQDLPIANPDQDLLFQNEKKSRKLSLDFGHLDNESEKDINIDDEFDEEFDDEEFEEGKSKGGIIGKVILAIIIVLLLAELAILGIKFFLPDSAATEFILEREIAIVEAITNWINSIKAIFSK